MKKTDEEKKLLQIVELFKDLGWDVMITVDNNDTVPGILAGIPTFVEEMRDALSSSLDNYEQQQYRMDSQEEPKEKKEETDLPDNVTPIDKSKKKTFH